MRAKKNWVVTTGKRSVVRSYLNADGTITQSEIWEPGEILMSGSMNCEGMTDYTINGETYSYLNLYFVAKKT
jgi:hypothetical protein